MRKHIRARRVAHPIVKHQLGVSFDKTSPVTHVVPLGYST